MGGADGSAARRPRGGKGVALGAPLFTIWRARDARRVVDYTETPAPTRRGEEAGDADD